MRQCEAISYASHCFTEKLLSDKTMTSDPSKGHPGLTGSAQPNPRDAGMRNDGLDVVHQGFLDFVLSRHTGSHHGQISKDGP